MLISSRKKETRDPQSHWIEYTSWAALLVLAATLAAAPRPADVTLTQKTRVRFATVEEGKKALAVQDRFLKSLSRFDLQARLNTDKPVGVKDLVSFIQGEVRPWSDADRERITKVLSSIRQRFQEYELPFPETILFVHTTGKDEGGAAYCRKNAVILPAALLSRIGRGLESLVIHELFHVLSSHNAKLRDKLYAIIGFRPCPRVAYPPTLKDRALTNPDGPEPIHYITLDKDGKKVDVVPILFASVPQYDPNKGVSFFGYVQFRLMVVERTKDGKGRVAKLKDGEPILLFGKTPAAEPSFIKQIGRNTGYVLHPDEILADNFIYLTTKKKNLPSPQIIEKMRAILKRKAL